MHDGIIAERYAKALLGYTEAHGCSQAVTDQVSPLLSLMARLPKLAATLSAAKEIPLQKRMDILGSAVSPAPMEEAISRFYRLLDRNGRTEVFRLSLIDYLTLYREAMGIRMVRVTTAVPDEETVKIGESLAREFFSQEVCTVPRVDPSIIGGFVVESWGYCMDASVRGALDKLDKQLKEKHIRNV